MSVARRSIRIERVTAAVQNDTTLYLNGVEQRYF